MTVNPNGGTLSQQWNSILSGQTIQFDSGLIYSSNGQVFDPSTGLLTGSYDVGSSCCSGGPQLLPDSAINRVFVAGITPFFNQFGISTYNLSEFTPEAVANLSQFTGSASLTGIVRWGTNGLAFILQSGCCGSNTSQVVLVQSPAMFASGSSNSAPALHSASPASAAHGSPNFTVTIEGSGFVPTSQVTWNGSTRSADYLSPTQLLLYVPATDVASPGAAKIVVTNPAPGGGTSTSLTFTVN